MVEKGQWKAVIIRHRENMTRVFFRAINVVGYNTVKMRILLICLLKYINDLIEALCFNVLEFKMENSIYSVCYFRGKRIK